MSSAVLKLWHDGIDWVIATSSEDADQVWEEGIGDSRKRYVKDNKPEPWAEWTKPLRLLDSGEEPETRTAAEWIAAKGRSYLGSTEW